MTKIIFDNISTILLFTATVLLSVFYILFRGHITNWSNKKNRKAEACKIFRDAIYAELDGLYPVTKRTHWNKDVFPRFSASIPKIESAAAEFRLYVSSKEKFDAAVNAYCDFCRRVTLDEVAAYILFPTTRNPDDKGPRKEFKAIVDSLLSFAEEK